MANQSVPGCTCAKVRQLTRSITTHYDTEVEKAGLKTSQYSMLVNIIEAGPLRPVDLAARMKMTASTMSRNLLPLVNAGWITVGAGPDARSRLVQATADGIAKRREAAHHWKLAQQALRQRLGAERVAALHALIDDTMALLGAPADEPASGGA